MNAEQTEAVREDTMIYRTPTSGSDETQITDIWGKRLETRVVDAADVPAMLAKGWVSNPLHIDNPPEDNGGFEHVTGQKEAALIRELESAKLREDALTDEMAEVRTRLAEVEAANATMAENLKAAEDLATEESKAKEAALTRIAEIEAAGKTLTTKRDKA